MPWPLYTLEGHFPTTSPYSLCTKPIPIQSNPTENTVVGTYRVRCQTECANTNLTKFKISWDKHIWSLDVMPWQKNWHEPKIIQRPRFVFPVRFWWTMIQIFLVDAVRTEIFEPTFRSSLLLPSSGWYTLTKLEQQPLKRHYLCITTHSTTAQTIGIFITSFQNHSRQLSLLITMCCSKVKSQCMTTFLYPVHTSVLTTFLLHIFYDPQFKNIILRFKTHVAVPVWIIRFAALQCRSNIN
jgi:hypothetical protein